ncbi:MAG: hypothetical protein ACRDL8_01245 [Solirubrobacteraceae bacterium]
MPNIQYVDMDQVQDPEILAALKFAVEHSTPRPEIQAIRARQPEVMRAFNYTWKRLFTGGIVDQHVKELCRLRVSQTLECGY